MALHSRMQSLRSTAHRTLAVAVTASMLSGAALLAWPAFAVQADEATPTQQEIVGQAETVTGTDIAGDTATTDTDTTTDVAGEPTPAEDTTAPADQPVAATETTDTATPETTPVTSVTVVKKLVDSNGLPIKKVTSTAAPGQTITPAAADFTVGEGYQVELPQAVTLGSDKAEVTLTYEVHKGVETVNAVHGKVPTAHRLNGAAGAFNSKYPAVKATDGIKTTENYADFRTDTNGNADDNKAYVEFDLGGKYDLCGKGENPLQDVIHLWRYFGDGRTYNATAITVSENGSFSDQKVIYNSDTAGNVFTLGQGKDALYTETADGKGVDLSEPTRASKVRVYMSGSTTKKYNHIVEIEVYGKKVVSYDTELEQAIDSLSMKLESGLYTDTNGTALTKLMEARQKLVERTDTNPTEIIAGLKSAEAGLTAKSTSDGMVQFLGGSLRYTDSAEDEIDGLRIGFGFSAPDGATIDWNETGWKYGLTADVSSGFQKAEKHITKNGQNVANLVLKNIPGDKYDTILYTQAQLTYTLNGEKKVLTSAVSSRSVDGVAERIAASDSATAAERALAEAIQTN